MEYAMDLFLPILGGLLLAQWLVNQYQWPSIVLVIMPVLGLFAGLGLLYKRQVIANTPDDTHTDTHD